MAGGVKGVAVFGQFENRNASAGWANRRRNAIWTVDYGR